MYAVYLLFLSFILAIAHISIFHAPVAQTLLLYVLVIGGLQGIYAFLGHYFRSDETANFIGWPKGNPFQKEIAFANLAIGIAGILCVFYTSEFWLAVIIVRTIFLWGAGFVHIKELSTTKNKHPGNAGAILYMDFIIPLVLWSLMTFYWLTT